MGNNPVRVYGIGSCDTCRKARRFLEKNAIPFEFHEVRHGLSSQMLDRWAGRIDWRKLLNKKSLTWRKIPETDRSELGRDQALALILEHPTLLKRPVFEHEDYMAVGFSETQFRAFLDQRA